MENMFFDIRKLKHLGKGAIIGKTVRIRRPENVVIGDYSIIDDFTYISSDLEMGNYCHIASNCVLSGGGGKLKMGDFVGLSSHCCIYSTSSDYISASLDMPSIPEGLKFGGIAEDVILEDHVLLGSHSIVLPGARLPMGFATTAQTVVRKTKTGYVPWTLYSGFKCEKLIKRKGHEEVLARIEKYLKERLEA